MSVLMVVAVAVLVVIVVGLGALLWAGSSVLLVPRPYGLMPEFEVLDYRDGRVTLPAPRSHAQFADTRKQGTFGLVWATGHGRLGPVEQDDGERVVRALAVTAGSAPVRGDPARLDSFVFRGDPLRDRGLPFEEVAVESSVGALAGWWLAGSVDLGVLVLHGRRRGERAETLRALPSLVDGGRNVLVLAYRNHRGSPPSPDGFYHYGAGEVDDVLAGVTYLADRGVKRLVLYGFSMGGAAALEAVKRWPQAGPRLAGVILDSPLVDPTTVAQQRAREARVPLPALWARAALAVAALRSGVRFGTLDQRRSAHRITVPVLLVGGVRDHTVPIAAIDTFAARLGGPVRYHRVDAADHIEAWNLDPGTYEGWLRSFLDDLEPAGA